MKLSFEVTCRSYSIEIARKAFLDLMDSESHATDNAAYKPGAQTLCDKLGKLPGVSDVEYHGHFGASVFMTIAGEYDNDALKASITQTIETHLAWCAKLKKDKRFTVARKTSARKQQPAALAA